MQENRQSCVWNEKKITSYSSISRACFNQNNFYVNALLSKLSWEIADGKQGGRTVEFLGGRQSIVYYPEYIVTTNPAIGTRTGCTIVPAEQSFRQSDRIGRNYKSMEELMDMLKKNEVDFVLAF